MVVWRKDGSLCWKHGNALPDVPELVTRRKVFSFCGRLVRDLPVYGWLQIANSVEQKH